MTSFVNTFEFSYDVPFSGMTPVWVLAIYFGLLIYLPRCIKRPFKLITLTIHYNYLISALSGALWILMGFELFQLYSQHGLWNLLCDSRSDMVRGRIVFYYYLNYLLKYIELFDTILLVIKHKPLEFLHVYHHSATLLLTWTQLLAQTSVQFVVIWINLFVHVLMYYYYARASGGHSVSWKRYMTMIQITQFVIVMTVLTGMLMVQGLIKFGVVELEPCHYASFYLALPGYFILLSYLVLFLQLYKSKYQKPTTLNEFIQTTNPIHNWKIIRGDGKQKQS